MHQVSSFAAVFLLLARFGAAQDSPTINTTSGMVMGSTGDVAHTFYGIRYAEPPIGDLRFMPPMPTSYSDTPLNATQQIFRKCWPSIDLVDCASDTNCTENYSEDCLFLDIYVPSTVDYSREVQPELPIMFWIHGGGFETGSASELIYDSRWMANKTNTIVVSINYRLGCFGGLVYSEGEVSFDGNQGIKDQQLALKWVYDNIENFGGNNSQITIFGESAGAHCVAVHLMSSESRLFYSKAILQSFVASINFQTKEEAQQKAVVLLNYINCTGDNIECLRSASALDLLNTNAKVIESQGEKLFESVQPYRPILDGEIVTQPPLQFFQSQLWNTDKKIVMGITAEETAGLKLTTPNVTKDELFEFASSYIDPYYVPMAVQHYLNVAGNPNDTSYNYADMLSKLVADVSFVCPSYALARLLVSSIGEEKLPVYVYVFDSEVKTSNCEEIAGRTPGGLPVCFYPAHAAELPYVFHSENATGYIWTPEGQILADEVIQYWGNFANTGMTTSDPHIWPPYEESATASPGNVMWPSFQIAYNESMVLANHDRVYCDFWDSVGIYVNLTSTTTTAETMTTSGFTPLQSSIVLIFPFAFFEFIFEVYYMT